MQVASLYSQLADAEKNQQRIENLFKANAATQQQLDDANTQCGCDIKNKLMRKNTTLGITSTTIDKDVAPLQRQIDQMDDQLQKCKIINPIHGTVLTKYAENHEVVDTGQSTL